MRAGIGVDLDIDGLLVEAHEAPETPMTTAAFCAGFLTLLVIEMLA